MSRQYEQTARVKSYEAIYVLFAVYYLHRKNFLIILNSGATKGFAFIPQFFARFFTLFPDWSVYHSLDFQCLHS